MFGWLKCVRRPCVIINNNGIDNEVFMRLVEDMTAKLEALSAQVASVDASVEALYEIIKTTEGITPEAAAALTAKVDEISAAVAAVATDD